MAREVESLLGVIFAGRRRSGRLDLEAVEMATRAALHRAGAAVLEELLAAPDDYPRQVPCGCGGSAQYRERRPKQLLTVLGRVETERPYYLCPACHQGQSPRDHELDVEGTEYSPGVRRMMAVVGSETSFDQGREQLHLLAGLEVTTKAVERQAEALGADIAAQEQAALPSNLPLPLPQWAGPEIPALYVEMDGTGVPVVCADSEGRAGKQGALARTREFKLGCVFTQTTVDEHGRPRREEGSTTYTGGIETAEAFGRRICREAYHRGWSRARKKVVIRDGAPWIWNLTAEHFPEAIQIVDLYHARQHLWELSGKLWPTNERSRRNSTRRREQQLEGGRIESLRRALRFLSPTTPETTELVRHEIDYFAASAARMRYLAFRRQHLRVGSGFVEAGCKTLIGTRLKRSGMFWRVRAANAIIALRCHRLSGKFEDYWENRRARGRETSLSARWSSSKGGAGGTENQSEIPHWHENGSPLPKKEGAEVVAQQSTTPSPSLARRGMTASFS